MEETNIYTSCNFNQLVTINWSELSWAINFCLMHSTEMQSMELKFYTGLKR